MKKLGTILLSASFIAGSVGATVSSAVEVNNGKDFNEINGSDRYETAVALSKHAFKGNSNNVVIASGRNFADALAGSTLAAILEAPLLLTEKDSVPTSVYNEVSRLSPKNIYILGGLNSVSSNVESRLKNSNNEITRLSGDDRYQTSLKIASKVRSLTSGEKKTIVVNGLNFADALSAGALGAKLKAPLVLTNGVSIPSGASDIINISDTNNNYIVGGLSSVNISRLSATRLSGDDRYATSAAVADKFFPNATYAAIVSGKTYPDGLSAISLYKKYNMPILLSDYNMYVSPLNKYLVDNKVSGAIVVGGTNSISSGVRAKIKDALTNKLYVLVTPSLVKPIEVGDTSVKVKIDGEIKKSGKVEVYVADANGNYPTIPTRTENYLTVSDKNGSQEVEIKGFNAFTKDQKVRIRLKEGTNEDVISRYYETTVVSVQNSAYKEFQKQKGFEIEMKEEDARNSEKVLEAFENALKEKLKNTDYMYNIEKSTLNLQDAVSGIRNADVKLTLTNKKESNDKYTGKFDFKIRYVTNEVTKVDLNLANSADSTVYVSSNESSDRKVPLKVELSKSGTVPDADVALEDANFVLKKDGSSNSDLKINDIKKESTSSDKVVYSANLVVPKTFPASDVTVQVKAGKDKTKLSGELKIKVVNYKLKNVVVATGKIENTLLKNSIVASSDKSIYTQKYDSTEMENVISKGIKFELSEEFEGNKSNANVSYKINSANFTDGIDKNIEYKIETIDGKNYIFFKNIEANKDKNHSVTLFLTCEETHSKEVKNFQLVLNFEKSK